MSRHLQPRCRASRRARRRTPTRRRPICPACDRRSRQSLTPPRAGGAGARDGIRGFRMLSVDPIVHAHTGDPASPGYRSPNVSRVASSSARRRVICSTSGGARRYLVVPPAAPSDMQPVARRPAAFEVIAPASFEGRLRRARRRRLRTEWPPSPRLAPAVARPDEGQDRAGTRARAARDASAWFSEIRTGPGSGYAVDPALRPLRHHMKYRMTPSSIDAATIPRETRAAREARPGRCRSSSLQGARCATCRMLALWRRGVELAAGPSLWPSIRRQIGQLDGAI